MKYGVLSNVISMLLIILLLVMIKEEVFSWMYTTLKKLPKWFKIAIFILVLILLLFIIRNRN